MTGGSVRPMVWERLGRKVESSAEYYQKAKREAIDQKTSALFYWMKAGKQ
jgi:hypothetical protein